MGLFFISNPQLNAMKYRHLLVSLFFSISAVAQTGSVADANDYNPTANTNHFILPEYSNSILDAENYFDKKENSQLNKLIDSVSIKNKLIFQFAFVTPTYFENDSTKFDEYVDTLCAKWNQGENNSRIFVMVCMQQGAASIQLRGNKLNAQIKAVMNAMKDKHELTDAEQEDRGYFINMLNNLLEQSNLGINLKSKNYVQAVKEFIDSIVGKQHLLFDSN